MVKNNLRLSARLIAIGNLLKCHKVKKTTATECLGVSNRFSNGVERKQSYWKRCRVPRYLEVYFSSCYIIHFKSETLYKCMYVVEVE